MSLDSIGREIELKQGTCLELHSINCEVDPLRWAREYIGRPKYFVNTHLWEGAPALGNHLHAEVRYAYPSAKEPALSSYAPLKAKSEIPSICSKYPVSRHPCSMGTKGPFPT